MNTENAGKEDPGVEEVLDEIVDLEEYAKRGERPPLSKGYRIRVNGEAFVVHDPTPTGREILTLAGLLPAKELHAARKARRRAAAQDRARRESRSAATRHREVQGVAARPDGGLLTMALRRQFDLLPEDRLFLDDLDLPSETIVDGSQWVLVHEFPTHGGYNHPAVTAAVRLEAGYPNAELHMVYFFPALARRTAGRSARRMRCSSLTASNISAGPAIARPRTPG